LYVAVFKLSLWLLDEKGADVNAATSQGATPVHGAFTLDLLSALLDRGADPSKLDRHGITALMSQATLGEDGAIARLLEDPRIRAIVNMRNVPGDTALHWACTHKSDKQQHAQVLLHLQAGADASIKGKKKDCLMPTWDPLRKAIVTSHRSNTTRRWKWEQRAVVMRVPKAAVANTNSNSSAASISDMVARQITPVISRGRETQGSAHANGRDSLG
jgi:hypothetical protein